MTTRPAFLPKTLPPYWSSLDVEFEWFPGFSASQKQRSIHAFHRELLANGDTRQVLEVSSKSESELGYSLSAFTLMVEQPNGRLIPFESAFQGSKVFHDNGQIESAYGLDPRGSKLLARETNANDKLIGFRWDGHLWPLEPQSWFYDWLYIGAILLKDGGISDRIRQYDAFTDIEFNPKKSFNCQARSCAIISASKDDDQLRSWHLQPTLMIADLNTDRIGSEVQQPLFTV